tara:strand:- start:302 stop:832 length:531 start_codon:yes stop_codon:yes gene_type:complete
MDQAYDFKALAKNYSIWFVQCLQIAVNSKLINAQTFKTKRSVKKSALDLFARMIIFRFALAPNDNSEKWLADSSDFKFGAVGFLLDILYIEADETSEEHLPCHLHSMPEELPDSFRVFMAEMSHIIFQNLVELECPDVFIFGEFGSNKTFSKKLDEDYSSAVEYFAEKYCSTYDQS